jgi:sugar lactone lactonase YvrE
MRIWDVPPSLLCRQHLLGEHRELHGLWRIITEDRQGYAKHPETRRWRGKLAALYERHDALGAVGGFGSGEGQFVALIGIAVDDRGNVYVADYERDQIHMFRSDGEWLTSWGGRGTEPGRFTSPAYLTLDAAGRLYVADEANDRVQVFQPALAGSAAAATPEATP